MMDLRKVLNKLYFDSGYLYNQNKFDEYKILCKKEFHKKQYNENEYREQLISYVKYGMIKLEDNEMIKDIDQMSTDKTIELLTNGQFIITEYGRCNIDLNNRDHISRQLNDEINKQKDTINAQVLTLMGIILAAITFIIAGLDLYKNPDFFKISFVNQILSSVALYIPLLMVIICLLLGLYLIMIVINNLNKK